MIDFIYFATLKNIIYYFFISHYSSLFQYLEKIIYFIANKNLIYID